MAEFIQNGGSNGGTYASYFSCKLSVWENWRNSSSHNINLGYKLELISGSSGRFSDLTANFTVEINGAIVENGNGRYISQSYNTAQTICEGETIVHHDTNETKTITCSAILDFQSHTYSPGDFAVGGTIKLTPMLSAPVLKINSITNVTLNSINVNYEHVSGDFYHVQYSLNNGAWQSTSGNPTILIQGLLPGKSYSVRIRGLNYDSTMIGESSNSMSVTTLAEGKITINESSVEFGEPIELNVTNPSNQNIKGVMYVDGIKIKEFGLVLGKNIIELTQEELDNLYRLYDSSQVITAQIQIITIDIYTYSQNLDVIFKGKKASIFIDADKNKNWKRGYVYIDPLQDKNWKRAIIWKKGENGIWKKPA